MQVLVVEDERRMAELLRRGLEEEGHSVILAPDGRQGLAMAESHPFDVILLDVMLPGMDGFAVARKLLCVLYAMLKTSTPYKVLIT